MRALGIGHIVVRALGSSHDVVIPNVRLNWRFLYKVTGSASESHGGHRNSKRSVPIRVISLK